MADALCGPSNPLQSFQKHNQVDRTLQQDRLLGARHSPAQGFRTPDPRTATLDAEFAAFEAGPSNLFQFEQPLPGHAFPQFHPQPSASSWAADFQKLQISRQPLPSQQFRTEAPLVRSNVGGWHDEFMRQRQNGGSAVAQGKQSMQTALAQGLRWNQPYQPVFQPQYQDHNTNYAMDHQAGPEYTQLDEQAMHDPDFERTFARLEADMAEAEKHLSIQNQDFQDMLHADGTYTNDRSSAINHDRPQETVRIGSDAIQYTEQTDRTADQDTRDADELAQTAGQLLNSVEHDTSKKFQESQFMALMRKIRDREVEVKDDEFKATESATQQSTPYASELRGPLHPPSTMSDFRPHDPNSFEFPDMNLVYEGPQSNHYSFDDDQFGSSQPLSQMQELHPGGKYYPEQSPPPVARQLAPQMSGGISAEDFEKYDESGNLATRYQRPTVEDENAGM